MKDVITLCKLIGLLLLFCFPLFLFLSINVHTKNTRNEFARPIMGNSFLVIILYDMICYSILHILTIVFPGTLNVKYLPIFHGNYSTV